MRFPKPKTTLQQCIDTLVELGYSSDDDTHFFKGDCHIWIMGDKIRLSFNVPGIDKEYIGPPLPTSDKLRKFVMENTF